MRKGMTIGLVMVLLAGLMLTSCEQQSPSFLGTVLKPPVSAPDFTLADQHGQPFRLSEQRGRVVLLYFGYTHCPGACPLTLTKWTKVHEALGADAERVRFVFINVSTLIQYQPLYSLISLQVKLPVCPGGSRTSGKPPQAPM